MPHERPALGALGARLHPDSSGDLARIDREEALDLFRATGLLFFRGFDVDLAGFRKLTERLSAGFVSYAGGGLARPVIDHDPTMMGVNEAGHDYPVPLHAEMSYNAEPPQVLWFMCERPAAEAGETTVADGVELFRRLRPETRRLFEERRVRYILRHPEGRWQQLFQTDDLEDVKRRCERNGQTLRRLEDGTLVQEFVGSALKRTRFGDRPAFANGVLTQLQWEADGGKVRFVRLEDGEPFPAETIAELGRVAEEVTEEIRWEPGDVVMLDNTRMLHGRRGFSDPKRTLYVRMAGGLIR